MPRKKRFYQPGVPVHAFQRGHNKEPVFFQDEDYLAYLRFLKASSDAIGLLFQSIGCQFVPYINKTYRRRGSLWEGRHKGNILESEAYLLACMRYIEMNPVRAGMVEQPAQYRWSMLCCECAGR